MAYLLDQQESLVSKISNPDVCLLKQGSIPHSSYAAELESWHQIIKKKLLNKSAKKTSNKKLSGLIRFYQSSITRLIDKLNNKNCSCSNLLHCHKKYLTPLISNLTESLVFINEQYKDFFDLESNLPKPCEDYHRDIINNRIKTIIQNLSQTSISPRLLHIMLHPLMDFTNCKKTAYTFNDKHFLYKWLQHLEDNWIFVFDAECHSEELIKQLIEWNLNSPETIDFFVEFITEKYRMEETKEDQLSTLRYFQKCFKQHVIINKQGYLPDGPTLKESLTNWVEQEIIFINDTCHINERKKVAVIDDSVK
ncbi:hypothetical protein [Carboxylicivirga marina]|uniref:Uncharacterized protein n=1 Tax=Carboxylicivirga marina TaxID=2800988 RepID=A0ABS1HJ66_9BACT|nr:hypothetical protein [Carboxylicivirga marina]MBK3517719.1 hypothetical protein [Carboxylicivirga marina]